MKQGQVYVSPSMVSMMDIQIGAEITFYIARNGGNVRLTVAGYYEVPFMRSSMIGMKGFLISEAEYSVIRERIEDAGMDALTRIGAMLHIFAEDGSQVTASEWNQIINEQTELMQYTEFVHSSHAISGFMLILQNAFSGLLAAFAGVLLLVFMVVMGHSISGLLEQEYVNMGILKTVGLTGGKLIKIQLAQYLIVLLLAMAVGIDCSVPIVRIISKITLTATGILVPSRLPVIQCLLAFIAILIVLFVFAIIKMRKIRRITPMKAIKGGNGKTERHPGKKFSGIYQCANDMGNNIGMSREGYQKIGRNDEHLWCNHYFLADS